MAVRSVTGADVGSVSGRASSGASRRSTLRRRASSSQARLATEVHHAAYDSIGDPPPRSWAAARATASAAYSSASSRLPVKEARARTMRGHASSNSPAPSVTHISDGKTLRHSMWPPVGTSAAIRRAVSSSSVSTR